MQFIIKAYDGRDEGALERRMAARAEHLENIKKVKEKGSVVCAGGIIENGKPVGSFLIMDFAEKELFDDYLASEPYIKHGVWKDVQVESCSVVIMNDEMVGK